MKKCDCINWTRVNRPMFTEHHPNCPHYAKKMIRIWTVTPSTSSDPCVERDIDAVMSWVKNAEPGEVVEIVVGEIDENIYNEMSEYLGP